MEVSMCLSEIPSDCGCEQHARINITHADDHTIGTQSPTHTSINMTNSGSINSTRSSSISSRSNSNADQTTHLYHHSHNHNQEHMHNSQQQQHCGGTAKCNSTQNEYIDLLRRHKRKFSQILQSMPVSPLIASSLLTLIVISLILVSECKSMQDSSGAVAVKAADAEQQQQQQQINKADELQQQPLQSLQIIEPSARRQQHEEHRYHHKQREEAKQNNLRSSWQQQQQQQQQPLQQQLALRRELIGDLFARKQLQQRRSVRQHETIPNSAGLTAFQQRHNHHMAAQPPLSLALSSSSQAHHATQKHTITSTSTTANPEQAEWAELSDIGLIQSQQQQQQQQEEQQQQQQQEFLRQQQQQPPNIEQERRFDVPQVQCNSTDEGFERFACPSPDESIGYRCIEDRLFCDGYYDCPNGEDEDPVSCMYYKLFVSHIDILTNTFLTWIKKQNRQVARRFELDMR